MNKVYLAQVSIKDKFPLATKFTDLGSFMSYMLPNILILGGVVFFFLVVMSGIGVLSGAGGDDPHSKERARSFLTYSVIGLTIMFAAYWIIQIINYITHGSLDVLLK